MTRLRVIVVAAFLVICLTAGAGCDLLSLIRASGPIVAGVLANFDPGSAQNGQGGLDPVVAGNAQIDPNESTPSGPDIHGPSGSDDCTWIRLSNGEMLLICDGNRAVQE